DPGLTEDFIWAGVVNDLHPVEDQDRGLLAGLRRSLRRGCRSLAAFQNQLHATDSAESWFIVNVVITAAPARRADILLTGHARFAARRQRDGQPHGNYRDKQEYQRKCSPHKTLPPFSAFNSEMNSILAARAGCASPASA